MRLLISTRTDFEAEIVAGRLREAGVPFVRQGERPEGREGPYARDIYVDDALLERTKQVLAEAQDVDDSELTRLSEQAFEEAQQDPDPGPGAA